VDFQETIYANSVEFAVFFEMITIYRAGSLTPDIILICLRDQQPS